jgi:hypothetical protein
MSLPYRTRFKLPLEYLTLQDWNNFVQNLLFLNQYGSAKLLNYYQNGNFENLNEVFSKYLKVSQLIINGYEALYNLKSVEAYTFGQGNIQPFQDMANRPTVNFPYSIPFEFIQFYPISKLPNYKFPIFSVEKLQVQLTQVSKQLQLLIPKLTSKIVTPSNIAGTQFQFSGSANLQQITSQYLEPAYLKTWREIIIQNLGSSPVQINNSIYLMPKNCLKLTASSPSEIQLTAQTPTLLSEEIEFTGTPIVTYTITITNSQSDPTPSPFQQLLQLNLSSILSSSSQLLNLEFCLDAQCQTPLYAWISQYNSNLSTVYIWVNLPTSIPANSSLTIYMFVRNSNEYPYTGINAYYNTAYDNGANVFDAYINAMGTSYLPSNLQIYSSVYSSIQFTPKSGSTPGYILMLDNQGGSYTVIYLDSTNAKNVNEIFESVEYYDGSADQQTIEFLGSASSFCGGINGSSKFLSNGYAVSWDPYDGDGYIWSGCSVEVSTAESVFTSSGYNFYQAIVTSSEIEYYGQTISSPIVDLPQLSPTQVASWSSSITPNGSAFAIMDDSGSATHIGYFYWARARKLPPNNVMPSNSQPQKTIIILG